MDKETNEILYNCSISTKVHAKTFFPERFYMPFAEQIHDPIFDLIDGPENKVAIAAPRGWGKTSVVALGLASRYMMFNLCSFIVYINKSETAAIMQTENLKRELVSNRAIKHFFGSVKTRRTNADEIDEQFSKKAWVAFDTFLLPRGAGQQVRGILFKNDRPGLFIIDDLEDPEHIESEDYRRKMYEWLIADVVKAVPRIGPLAKTYKIVYIDTLKHQDSVLQKLLDSPEWKSVRLEACDDEFHSTAPDFISDEEIQKEWENHVASGQTDVFFRELRNLPISTKDSSFQDSYYKYYNVPPEKVFREGTDLKITDAEVQLRRNNETIVILDPAKTTKIHSAETAIIGIGLDMENARVYIRDIISKKMYPDEIYDNLFEMAIRLGAKVVGVETTGIEEFIKQPLKNEMFKRGKFFEIIWLKARGGSANEKGKVLRIREMVPYYRLGYMYHNASCPKIKDLENQLRMFPRSKLWDIMDATAYFIEMLELGERYFGVEGVNPDDIESEYDDLEYDQPMENWRYV